MRRYLKADLWRIVRRKKKWVFFVICMLACLDLTRFAANPETSNLSLALSSIKSCGNNTALVLGLINMLHVYEDDFSAKTVQIVIGKGVSRLRIIFCKWLEMMILTAADSVILLGLMWATANGCGMTIKGGHVVNIVAILVSNLLVCAFATALTMILMYNNMRLGVGLLLYGILFFRPLTKFNEFLETLGSRLVNLNMGRILPGTNIENFCEGLKIGQFEFLNFLIVALYIAFGFAMSYRIFKKKELDF